MNGGILRVGIRVEVKNVVARDHALHLETALDEDQVALA
jgi:hypothetical protein